MTLRSAQAAAPRRAGKLAALTSIPVLSLLLNPFFVASVVGIAALVARPKRGQTGRAPSLNAWVRTGEARRHPAPR